MKTLRETTGLDGDMSHLERDWLINTMGVMPTLGDEPSINDLWRRLLTQNGFTGNSLPEDQYRYWGSIGHNKIGWNHRAEQFWADAVPIAP